MASMPTNSEPRRVNRRRAAAILLWTAALLPRVDAQRLDPIVYTVRAPVPATHIAEVEAQVPTERRSSIELMMPVWSPGFYRVEDYAAKIQDLAAHSADGKPLAVEKTAKSHWTVQTGGAPAIVLTYRVLCEQRSVTT